MTKVIFEKEKCIGCGACTVLCPDFWEMGEDRVAILKGGTDSDGRVELEIDNPGCNNDAVQGCPVGCIIVNN